MLKLTESKLQCLASAVELLDTEKYLVLKKLYSEGDTTTFRDKFMQYYHLNRAHPSAEFITSYFRLLFTPNLANTSEPYSSILKELYEFKGLNGIKSLQFSFVSKLLAMQDESHPLYDLHVRRFFGMRPPNSNTSEGRIEQFIGQMLIIRKAYNYWENDKRFQAIISKAIERKPELGCCKVPRIIDLLVWTAGRKKLY